MSEPRTAAGRTLLQEAGHWVYAISPSRVSQAQVTELILAIEDEAAQLGSGSKEPEPLDVERLAAALDIATARTKAREPETAWHDGYLIGVGEADAILDAEAER
jgi:hypothetical protein